MAGDLDAFYQEFFQEIMREADANGRYAEDMFFELFCEQLVEASLVLPLLAQRDVLFTQLFDVHGFLAGDVIANGRLPEKTGCAGY